MQGTYYNTRFGGTVDLLHCRIYFWKGVFSQWERHPEGIHDPILNIRANCAEQLMMAHKAHLFGDQDAMERILATDSPREQKAIGRTVKGYDEALWSLQRVPIVSNIQYLKFTSTPELRETLLLTHGHVMVEASPEDRIWGVGLRETDPDIRDLKKWQGKNLLGICIMQARNRLIAEMCE